MQIVVQGRPYRAESLTLSKLIHLKQMNQHEIDNYRRQSKNYPKARMERIGIPFMRQLEATRETIQSLIDRVHE